MNSSVREHEQQDIYYLRAIQISSEASKNTSHHKLSVLGKIAVK